MERTNNIQANMDELIYRRLDGTASEEENAQLLAWINESEENKAHYIHCARLHAKLHKPAVSINKDSAFEKVQTKIAEKSSSPTKVRSISTYLKRASAFAAAAAVVIAVYLIDFNPVPQEQVAYMSYAPDSIQTVVLADKSEVTINKGSLFTTPEEFVTKERAVKLEGNAFFDIARDTLRPFTISTGHVIVEVLGTSFDIKENKEKAEVMVSVSSGLVRVTDTISNRSVQLSANQQCLFVAHKPINEIKELDDKNYIAWKTGNLSFKDTPLKDALEVISEHYQTEIQLKNPDLEDCPFNGDYNDKNVTFDHVLVILEKMFTAEIDSTSSNSGVVYIKEGVCNN